MRDPIYLDIQKMMTAVEAEANTQKAKAEKAEIDYNKAEARTIERKTTKNEMEKARHAYQKASQLFEYYKIRLKLREADAKIEYKKAFVAGKDWPDPKEFESYELQKQLNQKSRNWSDHLPKGGGAALPIEESPKEGGGHE